MRQPRKFASQAKPPRLALRVRCDARWLIAGRRAFRKGQQIAVGYMALPIPSPLSDLVAQPTDNHHCSEGQQAQSGRSQGEQQ